MVAPKWEYMLASSDELPDGPNSLGLLGWELTGISTYEVGGGPGFTNSYKYAVKIMFAFKRSLVALPAAVNELHEAEVSGVRKAVADLHARIAELKVERSAIDLS